MARTRRGLHPRLMLTLCAGAGMVLLASCRPAPPPAPPAKPDTHYVVGEGYELGGMWSYPREDFSLREAGLATVLTTPAGTRTADGEIYNPRYLEAAHRTLQLPAIVTVTNLENGREISVRVNDRGPTNPGRVIGLSPRAAELLGIAPGSATQVRIAVEAEPSQALAAGLPGDANRPLPVATAPTETVTTQSLPPPPGVGASTGRMPMNAPLDATSAGGGGTGSGSAFTTAAMPPDPLPEQLRQAWAQPGQLYIDVGSFYRRDLAFRLSARLAGFGARVESYRNGTQLQYRVRIGPLGSAAEADTTLERVLRSGVSEAHLLVE